jgi:two-component system, sensor histidine kinase PdtaS
MPTPAELARLRTQLTDEQTEHLQRLLGSWSLLADLAFSDLLLLAQAVAPPAGQGAQLVVLGQVRPNNRGTLISQDLVGQTVPESRWDLAAEALHTGRLVEGTIFDVELGEDVPVWNIPVRHEGEVIGVLLRIQGPLRGPASLYERTYLDVFERLCTMVSESTFPFEDEEVAAEETPRVGDGAMVVDASGRVEYATPNAINALHRLGVYSPPDGSRFESLGVEADLVATALATSKPVVEEIERRPDVAVLGHCVPLLESGRVTGALILLRDVTDLRRLDRLVLSKDQAIREVHHRVKNNLQTISALLRLQARRTDAGSGRQALLEAERRIRSIAIVHEILSKEPGDEVPFSEIITSLVQMAEDSVVTPHPVEISVVGDLGEMTADVATPLAVALAELLQNAVEHAFVDPDALGDVGHVNLTLRHDAWTLYAEVRDNGVGLPEGFDLESTPSLGLSIVRDLVRTQLNGTIEIEPVTGSVVGGTRAIIEVPLHERRSQHPAVRWRGEGEAS